MKHLLLIALAIMLTDSSSAFAQQGGNAIYQNNSPGTAVAISAFQKLPGTPVQGAPYSASMTNQSTQTLADGNRIVQTSSGTIARDSLGRTRQDAPLPSIGNLSPADAPRLVFLQDPVAQASYTLNLKDKTAMKGPTFSSTMPVTASAPGVATGGVTIARSVVGPAISMQLPQISVQMPPVAIQRGVVIEEGEAQSEDLGSKTMEGVTVMGTRTTRTIPAGQVGNDRPL